jgi:hypothetical protein
MGKGQNPVPIGTPGFWWILMGTRPFAHPTRLANLSLHCLPHSTQLNQLLSLARDVQSIPE